MAVVGREVKPPRLHPPRLGKPWGAWAAGAALFALSLLAGGYRVYAGHQSMQLPLVEWVADPSLFPHDPFAATLSRYGAPVWWAIGRATVYFPIETILLSLFLLEKLCLLLAGAALARALYPGSARAPWAGAAVVAVGICPILGGGTITKTYFEQTSASVPFFLWAFAALLQGQPWRWAVACAAGTALNPLYGVYAVTYSGLGLLAQHGRRVRAWGLPLLAFAALAAPAFWFAATRTQPGIHADPALWLAAARARSAYHLFPLGSGFERLLAFGLLFVTTLVFARGCRAARFVWAAAAVSAAWLAFALVAAYVVPGRRLLMLQPPRATDLWYALAGVLLAAQTAAHWEKGALRPRGLAPVALLASLLLLRIPPGSVVVGCTLLLLLHPAVSTRLFRRRALAYAVIGLAVLGSVAGARRIITRSAQYRAVTQEDAQASASVREAGAWAKTHTPKEAVFLVPAQMGMFRALSRRSIVSSWQDGGAILWEASFADKWIERMHALGEPVAPAEAGRWPVAASPYPTRWTDQQLEETGRRFGADFCVLPADHLTRLPVVFLGQHGLKVVNLLRGR